MAGDARAKELIDLGDRLFSDKEPLIAFQEEVRQNFYPEREDFYGGSVLGDDALADLNDSYPVLMRRDLGNTVSAMLRPRDADWFQTSTLDERIDNDEENARYLEWHTRQVRSALYDPRSKFIRATKEGDHDFVTFGQAVLSVEEDPIGRQHLYFRDHHIRDCAWLENEIGEIDHLHRKDAMNARSMRRKFGEKNISDAVKKACEKEPGKIINMRVIVMPRDEYDYVAPGGKKGNANHQFVIVYVDADNDKILREGSLPEFMYVVPRWFTVSGSQYAYSPATTIALPDARVMQDMTRILLEAGEKAVDPPMLAIEEAVREVNIAAGAITWADIAYDSKLKEAVQPIHIDPNMQVGFEMRTDLREMLHKAFYVDKLMLPEAGKDMTAYEVSRRLEEHVRNVLPLFEPMEIEYNTRLLDKAHALLVNMGKIKFGDEVPQGLRGKEITWQFESPIQQTQSRKLVTTFQETLQLLAMGMEAGVQTSPVKIETALKDAIRGTQAPATWRKTEEEEQAEAEAMAAQQEAQQALQAVDQIASLAGNAGEAADKLRQGGVLPEKEELAQRQAEQEQLMLPPPTEAAA